MDFKEIPNDNSNQNKHKNKITLLAMALIFVAPVLFAYLAYFGGWFTGGSKSKGEVIAQPWHIDDLPIKQFSFGDWQSSDYLSKWVWLLVIDSDTCDEQCQINWFLLQQSRLGLNKHTKKTEFLLVLNQNKQPLKGEWAEIDFATATIANGKLAIESDSMRGFNNQPMAANSIYLMDPLGNIFMRYPLINKKEEAPLKSKDLRADISRVMKYLDVKVNND